MPFIFLFTSLSPSFFLSLSPRQHPLSPFTQLPSPINCLSNLITITIFLENFLSYARGYELLGFLNGTIQPHAATISLLDGNTTSNPEYTTWHRQDQLLLA
jgi:hypothetical protein